MAGFPAAANAAERDLLEPERAFALSVRGLDQGTVEARFAIAEGYYLYRDKLKFAVQPGRVGELVTLPAGKITHDQFFGTVETYRGDLRVRIPVEGVAPGQTLTVRTESQGCADIGVCYPLQAQSVAVRLPLPGAPPGPRVDAVPPRKSWFK